MNGRTAPTRARPQQTTLDTPSAATWQSLKYAGEQGTKAVVPGPARQFVRVCECGCGEPTMIADKTRPQYRVVKGQPRRFVKGHQHSTPPRDPQDRFWEKVEKTDSCWTWMGTCNNKGYGMFFLKRKANIHKVVLAHRFAYELLLGPIPDGLELDHVKERGCSGPPCVNPAHLEPVTHAENVRRGAALRRAKKGVAASC